MGYMESVGSGRFHKGSSELGFEVCVKGKRRESLKGQKQRKLRKSPEGKFKQRVRYLRS